MWIFGLPQAFIILGILFMLPEFFWWLLITRPREKKIQKSQRLNGLFWRIRDLEKDIYGEWKTYR